MKTPRAEACGLHTPGTGHPRTMRQPWGFAGEYLELIPNHRLTIIPDAGHSVYMEQPEMYTSTIRAFLAGDTLSRDLGTGVVR